MRLELIEDNYGIKVSSLKLMDKYFGTEIFSAETDKGRYIIKTLPPAVPNLENEGAITDFLYNNGIPVARLLKKKNGGYVVRTDNIQFHMQEFIEGEVLKVNTAPGWLMEKSADMLGIIHSVLKNYGELSVNFDAGFFTNSNAVETKQHYAKQLNEAAEEKNNSLVSDLQERIKHLDRISAFGIDPAKLTYSNSHGDYYIGQIIVKDKNMTVIDWTSACRLPVGLEVIMSYVYASPECKCGNIDSDGLKRYIDRYQKHFQLNGYDIKILPYLFYFQQIMCHYSPPYDNVPDTYKPVCNLINNFTNWLYENADNLGKELLAIT